jgi:hypothetical protein
MCGSVACSHPEHQMPVERSTWIASVDPYVLYSYVAHRLSQRQLRLFAVACCRRIVAFISDSKSHQALSVAESVADGQLPIDSLCIAHQHALEATVVARSHNPGSLLDRYPGLSGSGLYLPEDAVRCMTEPTLGNSSVLALIESSLSPFLLSSRWTEEQHIRCAMLRDIIDPFVDIECLRKLVPRSESIVTMADVIYRDSTFGDLPVLADMLEDTGFRESCILSHCRESTFHVRGCWVLDLLRPEHSHE